MAFAVGACDETPTANWSPGGTGGVTSGGTTGFAPGGTTQPPAGGSTTGGAGSTTGTVGGSTGVTGSTTDTTGGATGTTGTTGGGNGTTGPDAGPQPDAQAPGNGEPPALPADVCAVLQNNGCVTCHQSPTQGGAPMPLQLREDFAGTAADGNPMSEEVLARVQDELNPMPPPSTTRPMMSAADMAVLQQWFDAGMPGEEGGACGAPDVGLEGPAWANKPWPGEQCEYVVRVGAHGQDGVPLDDDETPYPVPAAETSYQCFYEKVPWGNTPVQALAIRSLVETPEDKQYVHHMVLSALAPDDESSFAGGDRPTVPGQQHPCDNPSGSTVGIWAPGALKRLTYPDDVGLLMPSGEDAWLELQVHYNNPAGDSGKVSHTAFEICATSQLGSQTAGVHWLGYENAISGIGFGTRLDDAQTPGKVTGVCTAKERARVLWVAPHMHELGRHAKMEVVRNDGSIEIIHDRPFVFEEQTAYMFDELWLEPGEQIRTTCTWDTSRDIVFGFASTDEMCFAYTLAYPAGALAGTGNEMGVVGGNLSCAGARVRP